MVLGALGMSGARSDGAGDDADLLVAAGRSNAGIAAELFVEQSTVKTHLIQVSSKLGVHSRTQAAAHALQLLA